MLRQTGFGAKKSSGFGLARLRDGERALLVRQDGSRREFESIEALWTN